jgi:hypothetical protein
MRMRMSLYFGRATKTTIHPILVRPLEEMEFLVAATQLYIHVRNWRI